MKKFLITISFFIVNGLCAETPEQAKMYKKLQEMMQMKQPKQGMLKLVDKLLGQMQADDPKYEELIELKTYFSDSNGHYPLEPAIAFMISEKESIYCKGYGLVYVDIKHNDKTETEVKLIEAGKRTPEEYAVMKNGNRVYELVTGYRKPVRSISTVQESGKNSFKVKELRDSNGDKGSWEAEWSETKNSYASSTNGNAPEPLPLYMANDYLLWGEKDFGYKIKFEPGYKDQLLFKESGSNKTIVLKTDRALVKKLDEFTYSDSKHEEHFYKDCYKVKVNIKLDKLEKIKQD